METLAERIARDGPVSELDAIGWAIRLAKRLEALHALGVAHGSVSPACIIAAGQDRNARAYLADVQRTTPSPPYQSPERIVGGDISAADDVWALAATLYALLTGQSPYAGGSDAEIRQKILAATPAPLAVYDVGDDDLQHILDHAFARELGQRTAGITALRRALEDWHPDRGVANLPPLEDEDAANDDDDGGRTMLVRDAGRVDPHPPGARPQTPGASGPHSPHGAHGLPQAHQDEDDEDDVRTMMRSMPQDDLAAIIARATAVADAKAAARAQGAPVAIPAPGPPRPALHTPASPAVMGSAARLAEPFAPAFGGRPAPAPAIVDDDSGEEEDDARTMMRTPEQMVDEDSDAAPRTVLLRDGQDAWQPPAGPDGGHPPTPGPRPAAGQPAAPPGMMGRPPGPGAPSWGDGRGGPSPAATMALPSYFEPASPGYAPQRPQPDPRSPGQPYLEDLQGTQKIPPAVGYDPRLQMPQGGPYPGSVQQPYGPAPQTFGHAGFHPQTMGNAGPYPPGSHPQTMGNAGPQPSGYRPQIPGPMAPPLNPQPFPLLAPGAGKSSKNGLIIAAVIALLIAAGATFAFLKLKGL